MSRKTNHQANAENEGSLLNAQERSLLSQIAAGEPPFSQRAQALLAIDEGMTQSAAGQQVGLSIGQVRYWLNKFRKAGIAIFPQELLDQTQQEDASSPHLPAESESPSDESDLAQIESVAEVKQEMSLVAETDAPLATQGDPPQAGKKSDKKAKKTKKQKKKKKEKKSKNSNKKKKAKKGKKSKKEKGSRGKSGKKNKKKRKKGRKKGSGI